MNTHTSAPDDMVQHALEYAGYYDWCVTPLAERGKRPFLPRWQESASNDEDQIVDWWDRNPHYNIGVLLGPRSNLIDIEIDADSPQQAEAAEARLFEIFGGEMPDTPSYVSRRGKHWLFQFTPDLILNDSPVFKIFNKTIEIRAGHPEKGLQSAVPPSIHPDTGEPYRWVRSPRSCDVAAIPDEVVARLVMIGTEGDDAWKANGSHLLGNGKSKSVDRDWDEIMDGVGEGERNACAAALAGKWLANVSDPFDNGVCQDVYRSLRSWNRQNKPPLAERELKATWMSILRRHRQSVANQIEETGLQQFATRHNDPGSKGTGSKAQWRLVRVESEPVRWKLYSPLWETKAVGGYITLSSYQMQSWSRVATAALEQASVWIADTKFKRLWHGNPKAQDPALVDGLALRLIESCDIEQAQPEEIRSVVVAQYVWECLGMAKARVMDEPDDKGRPTQLESGEIVVKFATLLALLQQNVDPPKQGELLKLFRDIGVPGAKLFRVGGGRYRFHVFDKDCQQALETMVNTERGER